MPLIPRLHRIAVHVLILLLLLLFLLLLRVGDFLALVVRVAGQERYYQIINVIRGNTNFVLRLYLAPLTTF